MDLSGKRYRTLASRCRQSADVAGSDDRAALLRMATAYDRKAADIEDAGDSSALLLRVPSNQGVRCS